MCALFFSQSLSILSVSALRVGLQFPYYKLQGIVFGVYSVYGAN